VVVVVVAVDSNSGVGWDGGVHALLKNSRTTDDGWITLHCDAHTLGFFFFSPTPPLKAFPPLQSEIE